MKAHPYADKFPMLPPEGTARRALRRLAALFGGAA